MNIDPARIVYASGGVSLSEVESPRGKRVLLDMEQDAVLVIPRTATGAYVLTKQRRVGKEEVVYEFPSGGIRPGESPEEAAARELLEEVGASGVLRYITKTEPLSGLVKFTVHIFVADITSMSDADSAPEEHEHISVVVWTWKELLTKIASLEVVDGYVLLGLGALIMDA